MTSYDPYSKEHINEENHANVNTVLNDLWVLGMKSRINRDTCVFFDKNTELWLGDENMFQVGKLG